MLAAAHRSGHFARSGSIGCRTLSACRRDSPKLRDDARPGIDMPGPTFDCARSDPDGLSHLFPERSSSIPHESVTMLQVVRVEQVDTFRVRIARCKQALHREKSSAPWGGNESIGQHCAVEPARSVRSRKYPDQTYFFRGYGLSAVNGFDCDGAVHFENRMLARALLSECASPRDLG